MATYSRSSFIPKSVVLNSQCANDPVIHQIKSINNDMRRIDAYVILGLKGKKKLQEDQRKEELQNQRRAKQLEQFQKTKGNPINFIRENIPRTGFLDTIKNFILYTFMGMAAPTVIKNLPGILNAMKYLVPIVDFTEKFFSNVLGGIVNAVDFGYKVHDKMRGILKNVTGGNYEKQFDQLEKTLTTFLNVAIIAGLTFAGSGDGVPFIGGKNIARGVGSGVKGSSGIRKYLSRGAALKYIERKYGYEASKLYDYSIKQGGSRARALANVKRRFQPLQYQGGLTGGTGKGKILSRGIKNIPSRLSTKILGKTGKRLLLGGIPIIGGLIDFTLSVLMGENPGRAAARAVGSTLGAALGALVPIPIVGSLLGSFLGDIVGGALFDTLSSFGKPKAHAKGGQVGSKSYSRTPRSVRKIRTKRPPKQIPAQSRPGKSIGGREEIMKIFPESSDPDTMSPLTLLTKNSAAIKRAGVFGNLMGAGLDMMALGQKVEKSTLKGLEKYLAFVIQSSIDNQTQENARSIGSSMYAMATGGVVPVSRTIDSNGSTTGEMVAKEMVKSFSAMLDNRSTEIFQNIRKQLELKKEEKPAAPETKGGGEGLTSGYGAPEERALLAAIRFAEGTTKSYGTIFGGNVVEELAQGKMTVKEVIDMAMTGKLPSKFGGRSAGYGSGSFATGAYQFMPGTLKSLVEEGKLKPDELFTPEVQDRAAIALAQRRKVYLEDLKREGLSANIAAKLAPEWASFPTVAGSSYYGQPVKKLAGLQEIYKSALSEPQTLRSGTVNVKDYIIRSHLGELVTRYSQLSHHDYISGSLGDIRDFTLFDANGNYKNVPVPSPVSGEVTYADWGGDYGNLIEISSSEGKVRLGHFNRLLVKKGQKVRFGEIIGLQGSTGRSSGEHVHIEGKRAVLERYIRSILNSKSNQTNQNNLRANASTSTNNYNNLIARSDITVNPDLIKPSNTSNKIGQIATNIKQAGYSEPTNTIVMLQPIIT